MRHASWVRPLAWMVVIFSLSSERFAADYTGDLLAPLVAWLTAWAGPAAVGALHLALRKLAHLTEYAMLGVFWILAFSGEAGPGSARAALWTLGICAGWAGLDEARQSLTTNRTASLGDVALDTAGSAMGVLVAAGGWRRARVAAAGGLWLAVSAGVVLLVVNAVAGIPSGGLWITVPAAAVALAARHGPRDVA